MCVVPWFDPTVSLGLTLGWRGLAWHDVGSSGGFLADSSGKVPAPPDVKGRPARPVLGSERDGDGTRQLREGHRVDRVEDERAQLRVVIDLRHAAWPILPKMRGHNGGRRGRASTVVRRAFDERLDQLAASQADGFGRALLRRDLPRRDRSAGRSRSRSRRNTSREAATPSVADAAKVADQLPTALRTRAASRPSTSQAKSSARSFGLRKTAPACEAVATSSAATAISRAATPSPTGRSTGCLQIFRCLQPERKEAAPLASVLRRRSSLSFS